MPHIIVDKIVPPELPRKTDHFEFTFMTSGRDGLVGVTALDGNEPFLLRFFPHKRGTVIKWDKAARPPKVEMIKKALAQFAAIAGAEILHSNIAGTKPERTYPNRVSPDYFLAEHDYQREVWVEVGFGSGRHLLHNAALYPDVDHVGIEIHKPSAEQVLKLASIEGLENLYVIDHDARIVLETLKPDSVGRIFVHFPVPWDDAPHRRVFSHAFIDEAIRVLKPEGTLELRSDSRMYYDYCHGLLMDLSDSRITAWKNRELEISSKYEDRWKKMGRDIYDLIYTNIRANPEEREPFTFAFPGGLDLNLLLEKTGKEVRLYGDYLLRLTEVHRFNETEGVVKLTMGALNRPQGVYLVVRNDGLEYYPRPPVAIRANHNAHERLKELLFEEGNA